MSALAACSGDVGRPGNLDSIAEPGPDVAVVPAPTAEDESPTMEPTDRAALPAAMDDARPEGTAAPTSQPLETPVADATVPPATAPPTGRRHRRQHRSRTSPRKAWRSGERDCPLEPIPSSSLIHPLLLAVSSWWRGRMIAGGSTTIP